ncbi:fasciclin-like arabinogalactan protein 2 [Wolffia australiana]
MALIDRPPSPPSLGLSVSDAPASKTFFFYSWPPQKAYKDNNGTGLTIFCLVNDAVDDFAEELKNLTVEGKISLLLFHGMPSYNSLETRKTQNWLVTTLVTTGNKNYKMTVQKMTGTT